MLIGCTANIFFFLHDASPLPAERQEIYADVRNDKIYTLGGLFEGAQNVSDNFLEYDATRNVWTELSPLPEARLGLVLLIQMKLS